MSESSAARVRAAILDPTAVFASPEEVERDATLGDAEKRAILAHWEEDAQARGAGGRQRVRRFARPVHDIIHADHEMDEAALQLSLQEHPVLPVADGDQIVGVLARAELARAAAQQTRDARITARVMMTTAIAFCYLDDDVATARALMDKHGCDHLLAIDRDGLLVGTVKRGDLPAPRSAQERPEIVEPHENHTQGVASTIQPGGLDVYDERLRIRMPRR
jgi:CBS domain-containing protein